MTLRSYDYRFNPNAKTSAYGIFEVISGLINKTRNESIKLILKQIGEVYLQVYYDSKDDFINSIKSFSNVEKTKIKNLNDITETLRVHFLDSRLKTLNNSILEILEGGQITQSSIDFILEKMEFKNSQRNRRSKTFISMDDNCKAEYIKESKGLPIKQIEIDKRRLNIWVSDVLEKGIEEVQEDESWGDHPLGRDQNLKGKRSVRLSFAGRVIYKIEQEVSDDLIINKITIVKITSCHDYKI